MHPHEGVCIQNIFVWHLINQNYFFRKKKNIIQHESWMVAPLWLTIPVFSKLDFLLIKLDCWKLLEESQNLWIWFKYSLKRLTLAHTGLKYLSTNNLYTNVKRTHLKKHLFQHWFWCYSTYRYVLNTSMNHTHPCLFNFDFWKK